MGNITPDGRVLSVAKFDISLIPASPDLKYEAALWESGISRVCGIDEAGRGCLAGPVFAAAVVLPADLELQRSLHGVRDSKQLSPAVREALAERIKLISLDWAVGFSTAGEIDAAGIVSATYVAVLRSLNALRHPPEHLLLDYIKLTELNLPQTSLVKGDQRSLTIAAASILAKTARDELMVDCDSQYPGYGFSAHKGYGTRRHRKAIKELGLTPLHRMSFKLL